MKFNYKARTSTGEIQSGIIEASSKEAAFDILKNYGLYVSYLEEAKSSQRNRKFKLFGRITNKDIVMFSKQLSIMLQSKVPLIESFQVLSQQTTNEKFKNIIERIGKEIEGGMSLSVAFSLFPDIFSSYYVSVVRSGEISGKLTEVFAYLADYLEKEYNFRSQTKNALAYPIFVVIVFFAVLILITVFVVPQITSILQETGASLPSITKVVIGVGNFFKNWGVVVLLFILAVFFLILSYFKTEEGKNIFDQYILDTPLLGDFLKRFYQVRFALNLSTMISGGLPIIQALDMTAQTVNNSVYKNIILEIKDGVQKGETISSILKKYPNYISPFFYQMVVVGERTGTLDTSLNSYVQFDQAEIYRLTDTFVKFLEPVIIIFLGIFVAILIASVLLPLYSIGL
ncbi:MAG: type II secretion system F family protein [Candidatus Pacebacteria bacterium]|nr:type II secretion system F family protein [Candidatus Paceibacterota bacterium]